ncbi:MAG: hypothetical protein ACI9PU_001585 [Ascidiaceihabitans sp.]|jgi:uncharacterized protein YkwD
MVRMIAIMMAGLIALSACTPTTPQLNRDGKPATKVYKIRKGDTGKLQFRMLDSVNALRGAQGVAPVTLNPELNAAAATHSRDMSTQNRPWHFGSDGSSPIDRVQRVGYTGQLVGENISETYEAELETLAAWIDQPDTRRTIVSSDAADMGFSWFQEPNGKIWWTLIMGNPSTSPLVPSANPSANRLVPVVISDETATTDEEEALVASTE